MSRMCRLLGVLFLAFISVSPQLTASITLGNQAVGTLLDTGDSHYMNGSKITVGSVTATVTSMSVYVGPIDTAPNNQYQLAIYADASGVPGAWVAASTTGTLSGDAWNTLPIEATLQPSTSYWLVYNTNGRTSSVNNMRYNEGSVGQGVYSTQSVSFGVWPTSFGSATLTTAVYSLYATAESGSSDSTPPSVTLTSPAPDTTVSGVVNVTADASDNTAVAGVQFQIDNVNLGAEDTSEPYTISWDTTLNTNGEHSLTAVARDSSGNTTVSAPVVVSVSNNVDQQSIGAWSDVTPWPLVAIHASLLKNGKVLVFDHEHEIGVTHPKLWDPITNTFLDTPSIAAQIFCSGHVPLPNGNILTAGGHSTNAGELGIHATYEYDPSANTWAHTNDMAYARWYPTLTPLSDGRVVILSGQSAHDVFEDVPEIYDPTTRALTTIPTIRTSELREQEYPADFLLPNGKVLAISPEWGPVRVLDVAAPSWTDVGATPIRLGSAVQYRPGKILMSGGGFAFEAPAATDAAVLDMNVASPSWRQIDSMAVGRYMHNLVMLPTGSVVAIGGADIASQAASSGPLTAEMWDPNTEQWTTLASMQVPRYYHSTALLLPDGRVLAAGGGHNFGKLVDHLSAQVYSPPYLFKGPRPTITNAPDAVSYGGEFTVDTPEASTISSVSLVSLASVTHSVTMNQIYRELTFSQTSSQITVTAPQNGNEVPPGYYMLFIVDGNAVPSVAKILQIGTVDSQPPAPSPDPTTVGLTTIGSTLDSGDSHYLNGSKVTTSTGGQITSMSVYVGPVDAMAGNQLYQVGIYTDNAGRPDQLVANSAQGTLVANAWNTLAITATLESNTSYWLMYNTNGRSSTVNNMYYDSGGAGQGAYSSQSVSFGTWPTTFPSATLTNSAFSLFATFGP